MEKEEIEAGERELVLSLTGTTSEELLRFATAQRPCRLRVHLCSSECNQLRENPDLAHVKVLKKIPTEAAKPPRLGKSTWWKKEILLPYVKKRKDGERKKRLPTRRRGGGARSRSRKKKKKKEKKKR